MLQTHSSTGKYIFISSTMPSLVDLYDALEKAHGFPSISDASVETPHRISSTWTQVVPQEEKEVSWTRKSILCQDSWVDGGSSSRDGSVLVYSSPAFSLLNTHLRLLDGNRVKKSYELKEHHGAIYNTSKDSIAECGPLLAYIAEEKRPTNTPYFQKKSSGEEGGEGGTVGAEYDYIDTFGEQLESKSVPCIVLFDGTDFKVLNSKDHFHGQYVPMAVQFKSRDVLVGIAVPRDAPYQLGLRFCSNRPSMVFQINRDGTDFSILHGASRNTNSCQIRSTVKGNVYWFDRNLSDSIYPGPHRTEVDLMSIEGNAGPQVIIKRSEGVHFYHDMTPKNCDLDENTLVLNTLTEGMTLCPSLIHLKERRVEVLEGAKHITVLDVKHGLIVGAKSSPLEPWRLVSANATDLSFKTISSDNYSSEKIFKQMHLKAEGGNGLGFNSFFVGPKVIPDEKVPLILIPHGGPHSVTVTSHSTLTNYFNELGFGVLLVNYRGSLGSGEESILGLLGNVGRDDVADCIQALEECCRNLPYLNEKEVFLFGGSHGGFLVTHLAGQHPTRFQGVVALNPVINIASMVSATDIPDWCFNESGFPFDFKVPLTPDVAKVMWEKSPIRYAKDVKAPIYLLIGKEDLRVPPSQGFEYYKTLKGLQKDVTMSVYPDNHPLAKPLVDKNWRIKIGLFFLEKLQNKL